MAQLAFSRSLCISGILTHKIKPNRLWFHTLRKIDQKVIITKTIPIELKAPKRNFFWIFKKRTKRELRLIDKPPANYELIYRCAFDQNLLTFQHFAFYAATTVFLIIFYQQVRFQKVNSREVEFYNDEITTSAGMSDPQNGMMMFIGTFLFAICVLQVVLARLPVRIYHHPRSQKYKIYCYGPIPNQLKELVVKVGEIKPEPDKALFWKDETFEHKETGQQFILFEEFFRTTADLYIMLGLQEDPDFNYKNEERDNTENKKIGPK